MNFSKKCYNQIQMIFAESDFFIVIGYLLGFHIREPHTG